VARLRAQMQGQSGERDQEQRCERQLRDGITKRV
jgi:hypothetical protein